MIARKFGLFRSFFKAGLNNYTYNFINFYVSWFFETPCRKFIKILSQEFSTSKKLFKEDSKSVKPFRIVVKSDGTKVKKKVPTTPEITVIDLKGSKITMYLEQAEKLAKRNNLELIKLDTNSVKSMYEFRKVTKVLNSESDFIDKSKKFVIKTTAFEHDLETKISQINKIVNKGFIAIIELHDKDDNSTKLNEFISKIEKDLGSKHKISKTCSKKFARIQVSPISFKEEKSNEEKAT